MEYTWISKKHSAGQQLVAWQHPLGSVYATVWPTKPGGWSALLEVNGRKQWSKPGEYRTCSEATQDIDATLAHLAGLL